MPVRYNFNLPSDSPKYQNLTVAFIFDNIKPNGRIHKFTGSEPEIHFSSIYQSCVEFTKILGILWVGTIATVKLFDVYHFDHPEMSISISRLSKPKLLNILHLIIR